MRAIGNIPTGPGRGRRQRIDKSGPLTFGDLVFHAVKRLITFGKRGGNGEGGSGCILTGVGAGKIVPIGAGSGFGGDGSFG